MDLCKKEIQMVTSKPQKIEKILREAVPAGTQIQKEQKRCFSTKDIHGPMFYKRRPLKVPKKRPRNYKKKWLEAAPAKKGICTKVMVRSPRKPNSGLIKIAYVKLSTGRKVLTHIPGIGHNLNVHSVVLVRGGRARFINGCYLKCVRGKYDLLPVKNRFTSRSLYGIKMSKEKKQRNLEIKHKHEWVFTKQDRQDFNQFKWMTWRNPDGTLRTGPLGPDEDVPEPITFNYKWKFMEWLKKK